MGAVEKRVEESDDEADDADLMDEMCDQMDFKI
jgi:hypothetical protein